MFHKRAAVVRARPESRFELDVSQRRDLNNGMFYRSHGSFELVLSPLVLGLLGFWLDHRVHTTPIFTVLFAVMGVVGAILKIYYDYRAGMEAARRERAGAGLP
jgi:F0F1-type ATP synthase assembly protein I